MANACALQQKYKPHFELPENSVPRRHKAQYRNWHYGSVRLQDLHMCHWKPRSGPGLENTTVHTEDSADCKERGHTLWGKRPHTARKEATLQEKGKRLHTVSKEAIHCAERAPHCKERGHMRKEARHCEERGHTLQGKRPHTARKEATHCEEKGHKLCGKRPHTVRKEATHCEEKGHTLWGKRPHTARKEATHTVRKEATHTARKYATHLFITVRLQEAALGGESVGQGMVVRLIQTLTLWFVDEWRQIHLKDSKTSTLLDRQILIIMYIYHALLNTLSAHMIHIYIIIIHIIY